jgi:hypothetical protein
MKAKINFTLEQRINQLPPASEFSPDYEYTF